MTIAKTIGSFVIASLTWTMTLGAQNKAPALPDLLRVGAEYVAAYAPRVSGATLEEHFILIDVSGDKMKVPVRIGSDLTLINLNGKVIVLRDVFAVDTKPTRERRPRIATLLAEPTTASWQQAQLHPREFQYLFISDLIVVVSEPTLALQFIAAANQPKFSYKVDGRKKIDGVEVTGVRFQEIRSRDIKYTLATRGNASASGRFWIDAATGRIHQTELAVTSDTENAVSTVKYSAHPALDLWLPREMTETYDVREVPSGPSNMGVGGYGARQAFQTRVDYSNPRYSPIDLTKIRR